MVMDSMIGNSLIRAFTLILHLIHNSIEENMLFRLCMLTGQELITIGLSAELNEWKEGLAKPGDCNIAYAPWLLYLLLPNCNIEDL